jgi:PAS domain S-box-containing protein
MEVERFFVGAAQIVGIIPGTVLPVRMQASQQGGKSRGRLMSGHLESPQLTLDHAFRSARDGIFVLDRDRHLVLFSAGCERITGRQKYELIEAQCICGHWRAEGPDDGQHETGAHCPVRSILDGDLATARKCGCLRREDGSHTAIETTYSPVLDDEGDVEFVLGIMRDVTPALPERDELDRRALADRRQLNSGLSAARPPSDPADRNPGDAPPLDTRLNEVERSEILLALDRARGQRTRAARILGISRSRLYRRMDVLGIVRG